jgi:hypothetical protein
VGQSADSKNVSTEAEDIARSVTRKRLVKTQQTEKTVGSVVNCRVCEVAICKCSINTAELVVAIIELLQLVITRNYSAYTLQFTTARTKSSQSAVSSPVVAW